MRAKAPSLSLQLFSDEGNPKRRSRCSKARHHYCRRSGRDDLLIDIATLGGEAWIDRARLDEAEAVIGARSPLLARRTTFSAPHGVRDAQPLPVLARPLCGSRCCDRAG